jgi:hypothetical protein
MTIDELGQQFKSKYPAYAQYSDVEIGQRVLKKYPVYQSRITQGTPQPSTPYQNQEGGILPYGQITNALAPTDNPQPFSSPKAIGTGIANYGKSVAKAGVGVAAFLDPISNLKKIAEFSKGLADTHKEVSAAAQSRLKLEEGIKKLQARIVQDKVQGKDTSHLEESLQQIMHTPKLTAGGMLGTLAGGVAKGAYEQLTPPAIQAGIKTGMDTQGSLGNKVLEGAATTLQQSSQDPAQYLPAILMGEQAMKGTRVGNAVDKTVGTISQPIQTAADFFGEKAGALKNRLTPDILKKSAEQMRTEKVTSGIRQQNERLKMAQREFNNQTKTYTNPDGTKTTVSPADTFAQYDIKPVTKNGKIQMGDYRTGEGELGKIKTNVEELNAQIDTKLTDSGQTVSLESMRQAAIKAAEVSSELRRGGDARTTTLKKINSMFDAYEEAYGDPKYSGFKQAGLGQMVPETKIPITEINGIRKEMNSPAYWDPASTDAFNIIGDVARNEVYSVTPDLAVKSLLRKQAELLAAKKYAEKINGAAVTGGRLGRYSGRTIGAIVGHGLGPLGSVIGAGLGDLGARTAQQSQFKSVSAELKALLTRNKK